MSVVGGLDAEVAVVDGGAGRGGEGGDGWGLVPALSVPGGSVS
jgi:hypothetical protein